MQNVLERGNAKQRVREENSITYGVIIFRNEKNIGTLKDQEKRGKGEYLLNALIGG